MSFKANMSIDKLKFKGAKVYEGSKQGKYVMTGKMPGKKRKK